LICTAARNSRASRARRRPEELPAPAVELVAGVSERLVERDLLVRRPCVERPVDAVVALTAGVVVGQGLEETAMASITKRPDGRWRARYRDKAGKEHAKHFDRKVDGQRWLDEVTAAAVTGQYVDPKAGRETM